MTNDNVKAVGFESFARGKNVKRLASVWRNSPEYGVWLNTYLDPENKTVEYYEEDNHKIGTFYRTLSELEVTKQEEIVEPEPTPVSKAYQMLEVVHEHNKPDEPDEHIVWYVKLGIPRWVKIGNRFGLAEYVFVDRYKAEIEDASGNFTHIRTEVLLTDEEQKPYTEAEIIYAAPSFMELWEVMFAIGETGETNADSV